MLVFRGEGLTLAPMPNGEFVTMLKAGEGMDIAIDPFFQPGQLMLPEFRP